MLAHILDSFEGTFYLVIARPVLYLKEVIVTINLEICPFIR
jgi:hypothetical protein